MFGFVTGRNCGNPRDPTQALPSIDALIDESLSGYLYATEKEFSHTKMYVYMFESLATTFREYKTLRMSEFYGMSQILLNPKPVLDLPSEPDFSDN